MAIDNSYLAAVVYSDGETGTVFPVPWPRINDRHIRVFFDGGELVIDTDFTVDSNNITLLTYTVDIQNELIITRFTPREDRAIVWSDGTPFVKAALDKEGVNIHYINQELHDWIGLFDNTTVGAVGPQGQQGIQGPAGPQGPEGTIGPTGIQGIQGIDGPQGVTGEQGPDGNTGATGLQGVTGPQGVVGPVGDDGTSFQIDEFGDLAGRDAFDDEAEGFTYYAEDVEVGGSANAQFQRFSGDGSTTEFELSFIPDGEQSLQVAVSGVGQMPDNYTFNLTENPELYTLVFTEAPEIGVNFTVREFSISTGFGAVFIKNSATSGDWGNAIPFGKGPRGDQGPTGITGVQGPQGVLGNDGIQGPQGISGIDGQQGPQGDVGVQGPTGPQGSIGPDGAQGGTGIQGPNGATGATGDTGATGTTGAAGPDGAEGRSSSGRIITRNTVAVPGGIGGLVTYFTVAILQSKSFNRTLAITNCRVQGTGGSFVGVELVGTLSTGGSSVSSGIALLASGQNFAEIPPMYITIPANTTPTLTMKAKRKYNEFSTMTVVAAGLAGTSVLVEIIPESTEIGS